MIKVIRSKVEASGSVPTYTAESGAAVTGIYLKLISEDPKSVGPYLISMYRLILGLMDKETRRQDAIKNEQLEKIMEARRAEREKRKEQIKKMREEAIANAGSKSEDTAGDNGDTTESDTAADTTDK